MARKRREVTVTVEQALFFRARRGYLAGPGAPNAAAAARALIGAQSQQESPSLLGLSLRTKGRPTAAALKTQLVGASRDLVRTWGQRDTLFVYDANEDWARVIASRPLWVKSGRRKAMPTAADIDKARSVVAAAQQPITRKDLFSVISKRYRAVVEAEAAGQKPMPFAAGRLIWCLAQDGALCVAGKVGSEQAYAPRGLWFPDLAWPEQPAPAVDAATEFTRRYLAVYGPATVQDVAHFFGGRVSDARVWIEALAPELITVQCGGRSGLMALAKDARALAVKPPTTVKDWPVRLLPMWDSLLMGHADKRWTVPDPAEEKLIWRKAAVVAPVVMARGRIVATWSHKHRARRVDVTVTPLQGWRAKHAAGVKREAKALAAHLGVTDTDVAIAG